tara:strand:+ start:854 stop:1450 length:597 start_codon:yes stop_codon:yes gene_type:complete
MKPILQKSFMDTHECQTIEHYLNLRIQNKRAIKQKDKRGMFYIVQGTALTDSIGLTYLKQVEGILGKKLSLSTTGLRKWSNNTFQGWHKNHWTYEYVVSIQISDHMWPIGFLTKTQDHPWIEGQQNADSVISCMQGDAVIFNGATTYHGRHRLRDDWCTTLMLYYVEKDGYTDKKDKRQLYGDENITRGEVKNVKVHA